MSGTVQQKWVQTDCTSLPGWPNNSGIPFFWTTDRSDMEYNGNTVDISSCDGTYQGSNAPQTPYVCSTEAPGVFGQNQLTPPCPPNLYSCGVFNTTSGNESYDGPGGRNYRVCAGVDVGFCPAIPLPGGGSIQATSASFDGPPFQGPPTSNGTYKSWQPTRIACTYPTDAFQNPVEVVNVLDPSVAGNPFSSVPNHTSPADQQAIAASAQQTFDTVMGQVCLQPASNLNLEGSCPAVNGVQQTDCMLISVNDSTGYGDACRKWCQNGGTNNSGNAACSTAMIAACGAVAGEMGGTTTNPTGTKFLDCTCINRGSNQYYTNINGQITTQGVNARCWFTPCNGNNALPYLIDQNTATQPCPSNVTICDQINYLYTNGDITDNEFNNYTDCSSSNGGGGGGGDNGNGGGNGGGSPPPPPPPPPPPSSYPPPAKKTLSLGAIVGISLGVVLVIVLLLVVFARHRNNLQTTKAQ